MGFMLLYGSPAGSLNRVVEAFVLLLLLAPFFEGVFLWKHLGREHRHPGKNPAVVFWVFLLAYVGIYGAVLSAGLTA